MRLLACIAITVTTTSALDAAPAKADERTRLLDSLSTSCAQYLRDDQWLQLDACHRAWFKSHEEAVWRLRLNPHGPKAGSPSS